MNTIKNSNSPADTKTLISPGCDPECTHVNLAPDGHGTVTYYERCLQCGALFSTFTGSDYYLELQEYLNEPNPQ